MRESSIEDYLVRRVKELGGECRKVQWIGRKGAPDRVVMLGKDKALAYLSDIIDAARNGDRIDESVVLDALLGMVLVWPELKAEGLAALFPHTPHERQQHREHERMRAMGQRVVVIDSYAGVEELLS